MAKGSGEAGRRGRAGAGGISRASFERGLSPFKRAVYRAGEGRATQAEINSLRGYATNPMTPKADKQAAQRALRLGGYKEPSSADFAAAQRAYYEKR